MADTVIPSASIDQASTDELSAKARPPAPPPCAGSGAEAEPDLLKAAWVALDDASQALVRARAIVVLMGADMDASEHHAFAADVADDLLRSLRERLIEAQGLVRQSREGGGSSPSISG